MENNKAETHANKVYTDLLSRVSETNEIWLLQIKDGLYAMFEGENNQQYIPVWAEKNLAEEHISGIWNEYLPGFMRIGEFLEWLKELKNDQILIGIFPGVDSKVFSIDPLDMRKHIMDKIGKEN